MWAFLSIVEVEGTLREGVQEMDIRKNIYPESIKLYTTV